MKDLAHPNLAVKSIQIMTFIVVWLLQIQSLQVLNPVVIAVVSLLPKSNHLWNALGLVLIWFMSLPPSSRLPVIPFSPLATRNLPNRHVLLVILSSLLPKLQQPLNPLVLVALPLPESRPLSKVLVLLIILSTPNIQSLLSRFARV
jgi:hypothetical protein